MSDQYSEHKPYSINDFLRFITPHLQHITMSSTEFISYYIQICSA